MIIYVGGTHQKHLDEVLLMITQNMFSWRIRKNISSFHLKKKAISGARIPFIRLKQIPYTAGCHSIQIISQDVWIFF